MKGPPLCVTSVFALFQQVLTPSVVRVLVKDPDAILDLSRVDISEAPAVQQIGQILAELDHLAAEVWTFIDADSVPGGRLEH